MNQTTDVHSTSAPKRRSCLGCLGRGAIGLLVFLGVVMAAGAM